MLKESVLIVEDELGIRELLHLFLKKIGYRVYEAEDGLSAIEIVNEKQPDVILLDIEMPGLNGFETCKRIRQTSLVPILFVSCKRDAEDKMLGFSVGGDDYITKPFNFQELEMRIQALLRRDEWITENTRKTSIIRAGELKIDSERCEVFYKGEPVQLLHKEFQLLLVLAQQPSRVWNSEQLYDHIWGYHTDGTPETVKVHISNLRKKLNQHSGRNDFIKTVRGFGYKFAI